MAAIRDVEVDAIEVGRRSLVELQLAHQTTARVARKQAVKELFGTLLASWEAGVPFDAMAKALTASGIQITPETLRGYFFELKTAEQLRTENVEHERAMAKIRKENEARQRAKDLQHARELAQAGSELASSTRDARVEAAHQVATQAVEAARRGPIGAVPTTAGTRKHPAREPAARGIAQPGQAGPGRAEVVTAAQDAPNVGSSVAAPAVSVQAPAPVKAHAAMPVERATAQPGPGLVDAGLTDQSALPAQLDSSQAGQARTLDEIARTSQGQKESSYSENLVLKEGDTVWYESGKPFDGYLSPRTLHTLRNVGRVIAPTEGRTAKDFVPMSHEL
jgi:hypothetical protein